MNRPVYIQRMASITGTDEPDYKRLIPNASLRRRMGRVVKMGVACAMECLGDQQPEAVEAIITATGLGCLADTEKFLNNVITNNEQLLNPTAFIQSTFNTVGAQIALMCGNQSYNMTYSHRGLSFESALLDGILRIYEGNKSVLVGAFDEITPTSVSIQQRMGMFKHTHPGEGSCFFLLGDEPTPDTLATVYAPYMFTGTIGPKDLDKHINRYLHGLPIDRDKVAFLDSAHVINECGVYPTASAYVLWRTISKRPQEQPHTLIYNNWNRINHSLILV